MPNEFERRNFYMRNTGLVHNLEKLFGLRLAAILPRKTLVDRVRAWRRPRSDFAAVACWAASINGKTPTAFLSGSVVLAVLVFFKKFLQIDPHKASAPPAKPPLLSLLIGKRWNIRICSF